MLEVMKECISLMVRRPPRQQGHHTETDMDEERRNPVVHFEMPYEDRERMATFYGAVFGWQTQMLGEDMGQYVLATTTETDANGPKTPGAINNGFFQKRPDRPGQYPSFVIAVDDIHEAIRKVTGAGGNMFGAPMEIPGVGQYVSFTETEGNRVSMLQPVPQHWHAPKKESPDSTGFSGKISTY